MARRSFQPYVPHEVLFEMTQRVPIAERAAAAIVAGLAVVAFASPSAFAQAGQSPDPSFIFVPPAGGGANDRFGTSLASIDDRIAIGSPQRPFTLNGVTHNAQGAVSIFRELAAGYVMEASLVVVDGKANDFTGTAVDMVGDWVVAGAPGKDNKVLSLPLPNQLQSGGVFAWSFQAGSWVGPTLLIHPAPRSNDLFGSALAMHREVLGDGTLRQTLVVAAPTDDGPIPTGGSRPDCGSVTIWELEANAWVQKAFIEMPVLEGETYLKTAGALFGTSVRIEGKFLFVGAKRASPTTTSQGAFFVFRRSSESDPAPVVLATDPAVNPAWGEWTLTQRIVAEAPEAYDQFGTSIDAQQDKVIVGAPNRRKDSMSNTGAAYIYSRNPQNDQFEWEASLFAADAQTGDLFGAAVAIWSDQAAIGAPGVDIGSIPTQVVDRGTVYLYSTDPDTCTGWTQNTEYAPPTDLATPDSNFGSALRIDVAQILIGAPRAPGPNGFQQGSTLAYPIDTVGCAYDLDGDGLVNGFDLALFFSHWGGSTPDHFVADYDGNHIVDGTDMSYALSNWGPCGCDGSAPAP